ncbi:MAG: hypothetical protein JW809_02930 [Pirellulales bacterium]|nr:hypothetical protein [Pirellulales bacterium]
MSRPIALLVSLVLVSMSVAFPNVAFAAEEGRVLWRIGASGDGTAGLALAPGDFAKFGADPLFVVGVSDAKRDWPYVHPGPADAWAGGRTHAFTICFGLKKAPKTPCRLRVVLADAQRPIPPKLSIAVNGRDALERQTLPGGGDASLDGDLSKARSQTIDATIEPATLKQGTNEITIATLSGSWVLYDEIAFEATEGVVLAPVATATSLATVEGLPALVERNGKLYQPIRLSIRHVGQPCDATVGATGAEPVAVKLATGAQELDVPVPAVEKETDATVSIKAGDKTLAQRQVVLKPVRKWIVYLLPHSHVDIGYTHLQADVERAQWRYLEMAMDAARRSADNPPGARFKWNVEVLWAVDSYLKQATPEKRREFFDAVKSGMVGLDALYGNELTGLCRPEELLRLVRLAAELSRQTGVPIESAMITDVPGYTWGIVPTLAHAGVKYFSMGPNGGDRIGHTAASWGDKPFWWIGPNGRDRILAWMTGTGYYRVFQSPERLYDYLHQLDERGYPYDMVQVRHCLGDNGEPDVGFADTVKAWNAAHAYPKLVIATTAEMFRDFESRYGDAIPTAKGDFTPYWEDGAASSARETGVNRASAERLVQAEALWAMLVPGRFPAEEATAAWRNVILYDEHTWGAHNSISEPDAPFVASQWKVKQAFALDGDAQSRALVDAALARRGDEETAGAVDVFNTSAWPRTDLIVLGKELSAAGDIVVDPEGNSVPSQRLSTGELAFVARNVPGLAGRRYTLCPGEPAPAGKARAEETSLATSRIRVEIDPETGAIASLRDARIDADLCDAESRIGLNRYYYVLGDRAKEARSSGPARIAVKEAGPLVASLLVESDAPGCESFRREIRVIDGLDRVDVDNVIDKTAVREKEGVHLGFAFNVPDGAMRVDVPWAVVRPEIDQIPGACKNWFTVGRWVDVSNDEYGVTWATLDAPLVEVGGITADRIGSLNNPAAWLDKLGPSRTFYSWVMNNHWHTNYKADQSGPTTFRYSLLPHGPYDPAAAHRFGVERGHPLVVAPARGAAPDGRPLLELDTPDVVIASVKPSDDGKAWIVRLFGASGKDAQATLRWGGVEPKAVSISNLAEQPGKSLTGPVTVRALDIVTLRAELPES